MKVRTIGTKECTFILKLSMEIEIEQQEDCDVLSVRKAFEKEQKIIHRL